MQYSKIKRFHVRKKTRSLRFRRNRRLYGNSNCAMNAPWATSDAIV